MTGDLTIPTLSCRSLKRTLDFCQRLGFRSSFNARTGQTPYPGLYGVGGWTFPGSDLTSQVWGGQMVAEQILAGYPRGNSP